MARGIKGFCEDISRHIRSRYSDSCKGTILNMSANEAMTNIDMFRTRRNSRRIRESTSRLVVG